MTRRAALTLVGALVAASGPGCGGARPAAPQAAPSDATASAVSRLLPLPDGHVFAYATADEVTGTRGMFVTRVRRGPAGRVTLTTGARARSLVVRPDGVARDPGGAYLLRAPLTAGASWAGDDGARVTVRDADARVTVPAGSFVGCVVTVEERGGDAPRRTTTTFCPDVGIAALEVEAGAGAELAHETARLQSFGPAVDLGAGPPR